MEGGGGQISILVLAAIQTNVLAHITATTTHISFLPRDIAKDQVKLVTLARTQRSQKLYTDLSQKGMCFIAVVT